MELRIDVSDLVAFGERSSEAQALIAREVGEAAYEAGALVLRTAQDLVPVDVGTLKGAIGPVEVSGAWPKVTTVVPVGSQAPYAAAVEFGRGPVTIRPRNKKALAFMGTGGRVVRRVVHQPPRAPQPFMGPALEREAQNVVAAFRMAYERALGWWAGGNG
jgi:hypothetical protein